MSRSTILRNWSSLIHFSFKNCFPNRARLASRIFFRRRRLDKNLEYDSAAAASGKKFDGSGDGGGLAAGFN